VTFIDRGQVACKFGRVTSTNSGIRLDSNLRKALTGIASTARFGIDSQTKADVRLLHECFAVVRAPVAGVPDANG